MLPLAPDVTRFAALTILPVVEITLAVMLPV